MPPGLGQIISGEGLRFLGKPTERSPNPFLPGRAGGGGAFQGFGGRTAGGFSGSSGAGALPVGALLDSLLSRQTPSIQTNPGLGLSFGAGVKMLMGLGLPTPVSGLVGLFNALMGPVGVIGNVRPQPGTHEFSDITALG